MQALCKTQRSESIHKSKISIEKIAPIGRCGHLTDRREISETARQGNMYWWRPQKNLEFWAPPFAPKNRSHNDCADWWLVLSYRVSAQSKYCRLWIDLKISRGKSENPTPSDCAAWHLVSFCRFQQAEENGRLWIDLKIPRGAPQQ